MKMKTFVHRGHYQESEKQPTEWEKIFENHTSDKSLVHGINELLQLNSKNV